MKVRDARPWTPEVQAEFETVGVVSFYRRTLKTEASIGSAIQKDKTISEVVRKKALELATTGRLMPESPPPGTVVAPYGMPAFRP